MSPYVSLEELPNASALDRIKRVGDIFLNLLYGKHLTKLNRWSDFLDSIATIARTRKQAAILCDFW
jgi:hypothetical protein